MAKSWVTRYIQMDDAATVYTDLTMTESEIAELYAQAEILDNQATEADQNVTLYTAEAVRLRLARDNKNAEALAKQVAYDNALLLTGRPA